MTTSTLSAWPQSWSLPQPPAGVVWLQRDLQQRQLQAVPPIRDGDGTRPQGSSTSELPPDLVEEADPDIAESLRPVAPPPAGSYHAALRLQSNHISSVQPGAFAALPWLCGLDLSLNHLEALELTPETVPRLRTLCLRNNRLRSAAPLGALISLRQLDISLNQIESLEGLEGLEELTALSASGNRIASLPAVLPPSLRLLDLQHNALRSLSSLAPLSGLRTLRLSRNLLAASELPRVAAELGRLEGLLRLTLYGNPCSDTASYPNPNPNPLPSPSPSPSP